MTCLLYIYIYNIHIFILTLYSVAFTTFTVMCAITSILLKNIFITRKRNPIPIGRHPHSLPQPLATTNPLPVSGCACSGPLTYMELHTVWPLCLASLTQHHVLEAHPRCSGCQSFAPFHDCFCSRFDFYKHYMKILLFKIELIGVTLVNNINFMCIIL